MGILRIICLIILFTIPALAISVINQPLPLSEDEGDVYGPATNTDLHVPQWEGNDTKKLQDGFPISTQGQTWVNLSSTANMRSNLGLSNHQLITVASSGIIVPGNVTANTQAISGTSNLTGKVITTTIQAATSQGILFLCSNGTQAAQVDGGGGCQITSPVLVATVNVATPLIKARTSSGLSLQDDGGNIGLSIADGGKVRINTTSTQGQLNVSGDIRVTGNIYESNSAYAELYVSYNTTVTAITSAGVYATITANVNVDDIKNFTFTSSATDKYLTASVSGLYMFTVSMSFKGGNSDEFHGGISINGAKPSGKHEFSRKMGAGGDIGSASTCGIITLAAGNTIRLNITNETDADDPTVQNLNFSIRRITAL